MRLERAQGQLRLRLERGHHWGWGQTEGGVSEKQGGEEGGPKTSRSYT